MDVKLGSEPGFPANPMPEHPDWADPAAHRLWAAVHSVYPDLCIVVGPDPECDPATTLGSYAPHPDVIYLNPYRAGPFTLLHELAHWTGHPYRLNRNIVADMAYGRGRLGVDDFPRLDAEETLANAVALSLMNMLGIPRSDYCHYGEHLVDYFEYDRVLDYLNPVREFMMADHRQFMLDTYGG